MEEKAFQPDSVILGFPDKSRHFNLLLPIKDCASIVAHSSSALQPRRLILLMLELWSRSRVAIDSHPILLPDKPRYSNFVLLLKLLTTFVIDSLLIL